MADGKQGTQQEAWRAYLELAMGMTEASKKKAQKVAKRLAGRGGATAQQLQAFADNLVSTSLANREALTKLVRFEVDRALGAVGLATAEEVAELNSRVRDLERQLGAAGTAPAPARGVAKATTTAAKKAPAKKAVAKKAVAKRTVAKKAPAKKSGSLATGAATPGTAPSEGTARKVTGRAAVAKKVAPPSGLAPE